MLKCSNCGNNFDEEKYYRICPKCGTYNKPAAEHAKDQDLSRYFEALQEQDGTKQDGTEQDETPQSASAPYTAAQPSGEPAGRFSGQAPDMPYGNSQSQASDMPYGNSQGQAPDMPYGNSQSQASDMPYGNSQGQAPDMPYGRGSQTATAPYTQRNAAVKKPVGRSRKVTWVLAAILLLTIVIHVIVAQLISVAVHKSVTERACTEVTAKEKTWFPLDQGQVQVIRAVEVDTSKMNRVFSSSQKMIAVYCKEKDKGEYDYESLQNTYRPYVLEQNGTGHDCIGTYEMEDYYKDTGLSSEQQTEYIDSIRHNDESYFVFLVDKDADQVTFVMEDNYGDATYYNRYAKLKTRVSIPCTIEKMK